MNATKPYLLDIMHVGHPATASWPDWPEHNTVAGLLDAMSRWPLDTHWSHVGDEWRFSPGTILGPFKSAARRCGGEEYTTNPKTGGPAKRYLSGGPIYPDHTGAVGYCGNFLTHSFGFYLTTDDPAVIADLDAAIAANLQRQGA